MHNNKLDLKRVVQLQTQLLKIIKDVTDGKITAEEAKVKSHPLHQELDGH